MGGLGRRRSRRRGRSCGCACRRRGRICLLGRGVGRGLRWWGAPSWWWRGRRGSRPEVVADGFLRELDLIVLHTTPLLTQCLLYQTFFRASSSVIYIDGLAIESHGLEREPATKFEGPVLSEEMSVYDETSFLALVQCLLICHLFHVSCAKRLHLYFCGGLVQSNIRISFLYCLIERGLHVVERRAVMMTRAGGRT